mmetsp:Transcript_18428/g.39856  ORF Transcript_18428/g.39856 Transcript_18428/m.39856 type:complete len:847 (+) Transcript_18428:111-2651(+)|eukprot:CAMPEP_0172327050 /NCGR_PEP_ID=MMETSP1058-20130122/58436_1 /TAXON_ID=83371 /ORGANISM="Detonula confervacea, Strain CCMP 353" /LENGTH=846 /DNA_ID=CAMNT_0013043987 /DNA_START=52 /DNA_END=2592 /DNA_ORIENTATION=-
MKKRRHNHPNSQQQPNLDNFDDHDDNNGPTIADPAAAAAAGVGGMSRAAKKRAKKRAKTSLSATAAVDVDDNKEGATNGKVSTTHGQDNSGNNQDKQSKMQLPFDDDDDGNEGEDLLGALKQFRMKKPDGILKKKKKKQGVAEAHDAPTEGGVPGDKPSSVATKQKTTAPSSSAVAQKEHDTMEVQVDDDEDDLEVLESTTEMDPELEALLSTLTPAQILLLDSKKPSSSPPKTDVSVEAAAEEPPTEAMLQNNDDGALAGIDPLQLIGDLTTEHRARILLSSLLSPSGVTLYQFYKRYWGQRPLLACLELEEENEKDGDKKKDGEKESKEEEEEDEALAFQHATRLDGFLNRSLIDEMIQRNKLRYGLDLNVTRFTDTMGNGLRHRITLDPPPKKRKNKKSSGGDNNNEDNVEYVVANPKDVWSNVDASHCTLRLLRPHEHNDNIHAMLSLLESEFGCMAGSNAYFTPLNSQGFAPHYDDVDVFILQLEGYKRWRVYAPFNKRETLPRASSRDYTEAEVEENGEELMDVVLGPGDVLYLPRGWIHQAETVPRPSHMPKIPGKKDDHSLHLTVSAMQNWCWADFLEILMPGALEDAAASEKSISLREGLPQNFLSYMGTMHQVDDEDVSALPEGLKQMAEALAKNGGDGEGEVDEDVLMEIQAKQRTVAQQKLFKEEAKKRIMRVCKQAMSMLDDACDQIGKRFLSDRLPPALLEPERSLTKEALSDPTAPHHHDASKKIWPNTLCRLVRPNIARLVMEEGKAVLYHCLDNSRVFQGTPLSPMEFEIDDAPALEQLLTTAEPHWIMVKDLIHGDVEDKMEVAQALFDEGILATMLVETPDRSVQTG